MVKTSIVFFILLMATDFSEGVENPFPEVAKSYVLYSEERLLWAHKPRLKVPPASLVKMMTALIVIENASLYDVVVVSSKAAEASGSKIGLQAQEKWLVVDLLTAALIRSANDACLALAEHLGANEESFVKAMNRKASLMGLKNTRFANACGLDHKDHYTTAEDMARLAFVAIRNETFARIVSLDAATISPVGGGRSITFKNTNALIGRYPWARGIKTGFTARAGKCLVALAERDGISLMLVLMNAPDRWWKAEEMLDRAFAVVMQNRGW